MLNEKNNTMPENSWLAAVLEEPDAILKIKMPTEKIQLAAVQKKPELIRHLPFATEKVQISAVITSAESILLMHDPSPTACFIAVEGMLKLSLFPGRSVLETAKKLVLQMQKDKLDGEPSTAAIENFLTEVEPFKN